jgi:hypothetical protein
MVSASREPACTIRAVRDLLSPWIIGASNIGETAIATARLARDGPGWLRRTTTLDDAREWTRVALERRAANFLDVARRLIYANPSSPYLELLRHAGCELGDIERMVVADGLEGALANLAASGVYVTDDEWKGRIPIRRGSLTFTPGSRRFWNPCVPGHHIVYSGGSGGRPNASPRSLAQEEQTGHLVALVRHAHGLDDHRIAVWRTGLGGAALHSAKIGRPIRHWFYPVEPLPLGARVTGLVWSAIFARGGVRIPRPRFVDIRDPRPLARWLATSGKGGEPIALACSSSSAVRLSAAANAEGLRLDGTAFMTRSEPLTPARAADIAHAGARAIGAYGANDITHVAEGCANGRGPDDSHLVSSLYAMTTHRREILDGQDEVDALLFTTLSTAWGTVGLNVELGDFADVEERPGDCCAIGEIGFTTHLSNIRSFEKLTGEGVSVARSAIVRVIEHELPSRFGGSSVDYQLVERHDANALTRLILSIDPSVGQVDEALVREQLLGFLRGGDIVDRYSASLWERADSIVVERARPRATAAGKVLPFYYDRSG